MEQTDYLNQKNFLKWLRATPTYTDYRHAHLAGGQLRLMKPSPGNPVPPTGRYWKSVELPTLEDAADWWEDLMESEITDFWISDWEEHDEVILCAASVDIWRPRDSIHTEAAASEFELVDDQQFEDVCRRYFDKHLFNHMMNEVRLVGFSVRRKIRVFQNRR